MKYLIPLCCGWLMLASISCGDEAPGNPGPEEQRSPAHPNILWITAEDMSPHLGCYGDSYARTPSLDALAARSVRYTRAFAPTGVCATARSSLIMGMYASSIGAQAMRCKATLPDSLRPFPYFLRQAGYYCTNAVKTDYNFEYPKGTWDDSSRTAHWRNRKPGQPFFSVFNHVITHESRIRGGERYVASLTKRHDPAKAELPAYLPDTPLVRKEWARYHDLITVLDAQVAKLLEQLNEDGLADDTIVCFFSDHGVGLPRAKQFIFDSGMQTPLLVHVPEKWKHLAPSRPGTALNRMVSFVDFGPSMLSLAGVAIPETMQGTPFLGKAVGPPRKFIYGIRDRMDERIDMSRTVRGERFKYHRNYMPHLPHFPWLDYMDMLDTSKEFRRLAKSRQLKGGQAYFMAERKSLEELYDLANDPFELNNLANDPQYVDELAQLREAHFSWVLQTKDTGFLPEQMLRDFAEDSSEYEHAVSGKYPLEKCIATARLIEQGGRAVAPLTIALADDAPPVRFWAATGLATLGQSGSKAEEALIAALNDEYPEVALAAAEALCNMDRPQEALPIVEKYLSDERQIVRLTAANIVDRIDEKALPLLGVMRRETKTKRQGEFQFFTTWVLDRAIAELETIATQQQTSEEKGPLIDVGVASVDISPRIPIRLQGFPTGARSKETTQVAQRIHAKAIAIGGKEPTLLVVADLIGVSDEISEQLFQRLKQSAGFADRARLTVATTHAHSAPAVDTVLPYILRAEPTPTEAAHIKQYTAFLLDRLEEVALTALQGRQPSRLGFSRGAVDFAINRRVLANNRWKGFGHASAGAVDHDLPLLTVRNAEGDLTAVWLNYACHGVCWHETSVHGDWMGVARERLETAHPGAVAIITIGCAGDQNPVVYESSKAVLYGLQIFDEVQRLLAGPQRPIHHAPVAHFKKIDLPLSAPPSREEWNLRKDWYGKTIAKQLEEGKTPPKQLPYVVQTWTYGDDLTQVFLSGEVVVEYSLRLKRELGHDRLWVSAYANSQPGYIPSEQMLPEGGYEVDQSRTSYGVPARLGKETENLIIRTVHELAATANGPAAAKREQANATAIVLTAAAAEIIGPKIKFDEEQSVLAWWSDQDHAQWDIKVDKAGEYEVVLTWSAADESAGRPFALSVDERPMLKGVVGSTVTWRSFHRKSIGTITLTPGSHKIVLKPDGKFKRALMDLRDIRLTPKR